MVPLPHFPQLDPPGNAGDPARSADDKCRDADHPQAEHRNGADIAALNTIEMVTVPWWFLEVSGEDDNRLADWMESRLPQLEKVLNEREWLAANRFTVADLLMADVLRVSKVRSSGNRPATESYVTRATDRPSFKKARADQLAHFAAADAVRS